MALAFVSAFSQVRAAEPLIPLVGTEPSPFMKMIRGEMPAFKIYEDEHVFAFLARDQVNLGHTLIVPKVEIPYFLDVPEPYYSAVFRAAKDIGAAIHAATGCQRVGSVIHGYSVAHFHFHLIPMFSPDDLLQKKPTRRSAEDNAMIQKKIIAALGKKADAAKP